jgi:hypothetical protein
MPNQTYDIVFSGQLIEGGDLAQARHRLSNLFKANDNQLDRLFSGKPIVIKSGVDDETATKYRVAFRNAGALVDIRPSTKTPESSTNDTSPNNKPDALTLLPPNTGSLIDCAKEVTPQPIPDISFMSLVSSDAVIGESPEPKPAEIDTSHLTVSPANSGTLEDCKKKIEPYPIPDISHLDIDKK